MAAKDGSKESQALPPGGAEKPRKTSRVKRLVILLTILLITLSAAGGAAYWWIFLRDPAAASSADAAAETAAPAENAAPAGASSASGGKANTGKADANAAPGAGARIEAQQQMPRTQGIVLPLEPIRVNLTDPSGRRYLTVSMEIEANSDVSADLKAQGARINDAIIMLLAGKTYGDISTPEGKVLLKHEIAARLNQILGAQRIIRVYFTNFVVE